MMRTPLPHIPSSHRQVQQLRRLLGIVSLLLGGALTKADTLIAAESDAVAVPYTLTETGQVALVINDAAGRRVRNLIAEADRGTGQHVETWDGRDDAGQLVPPGEYQVVGAVTPPLHLRYEFTLYNSGTVPWWRNVDNGNPMREKGGWMSDHSSPWDVATLSNLVFLAADATEHGNSLNVVDLDGKQVWATRWLGLAGARFVATDDRWAYAACEGAWIGNNFKLFVLSPRNFQFREIAGFNFQQPQDGRGGGLSGLAAHRGQVAVAFNGKLTDGMSSAVTEFDWGASTLAGLQPAQAAAILRAAEPNQPWINWPLPDGTNTSLRIAWNGARTIGAVLSPHRLDIATLKPDATYPGDLGRDADWEPLTAGPASAVMNVYTAPGSRTTRALRVRVLDAVPPRAWAEPQGESTTTNGAPTHFVGMRILTLGVGNVSAGATCSAGSGTVLPGGAWENVQETDITPEQPAVYTMQLAQPVMARALVVRDPFFLAADVEIQTVVNGPWTKVGQLTATVPWRRAYTEATLDFHRDTPLSAVRLAVTRPATTENADAKKRTGGRRNICSLGGVVVLGARPGDPAVPPDWGQRIVIYAAQDGRVLREIAVAAPGALEFDAAGRLYAVSGNQVVHVPLDGSLPQPVIAQGVARPTGLTIDSQGQFYVSDSSDHVVKRFTPAGQLDLTIGKPGGIDVGPYDPERMSNPRGLALDSRGRLWVAERDNRPKKVSVWSLADEKPALDKYYVGNAPYGGGFMYPDPRNPSRFFFQGMEFEADWATGASRIKNILWRGSRGLSWDGTEPSRPVYRDGRLYLVADPHTFYGGSYYAVARYDEANAQAVPVAAAGQANGFYSMGVGGPWPPLQDPAMRHALGLSATDNPSFVWSDLNGDGRPQPSEVQIDRTLNLNCGAWSVRAGDNLALQFGNLCLVPAEFTGDGVPVYTFKHTLPTPPSVGPSTPPYGKNYHGLGLTQDDQIVELSSVISVRPRTSDPLWTYPAPWPGTQMNPHAGPPGPGRVIGQLGVIGTAVLPNLGEVVAFVANKGEIYVFTTDGLFVARLFRDTRYGRCWNFPEAIRGMEVGGVSINGEHFGGTFTQMADGRILLVVGHNHNSVVRVEGLENIRRFNGKVAFTPAQYLRAEQKIVRTTVAKAEPKTRTVPRAPAALVVDGNLTDWPAAAFTPLQGVGAHAGRVALAWDPDRLFAAWEVRGRPDLQNDGDDWTLLFKSGDSVDLHLGINPQADRARSEPAPGDWRLTISRFKGEPVAVLYRYRVGGATAASRKTFASPVGSVDVDVVERIEADIKITAIQGGYTVEAAIPWTSLHAAPPTVGSKWRGDLGILFASEGGGWVSDRLYWSNREASPAPDVPGEIRLRPALWGDIRFE